MYATNNNNLFLGLCAVLSAAIGQAQALPESHQLESRRTRTTYRRRRRFPVGAIVGIVIGIIILLIILLILFVVFRKLSNRKRQKGLAGAPAGAAGPAFNNGPMQQQEQGFPPQNQGGAGYYPPDKQAGHSTQPAPAAPVTGGAAQDYYR